MAAFFFWPRGVIEKHVGAKLKALTLLTRMPKRE
jgi:hypothetical protein